MPIPYRQGDFGPAPWQLDRRQERRDWLEGLDRDDILTFISLADRDEFPSLADYGHFIDDCEAELTRRDKE